MKYFLQHLYQDKKRGFFIGCFAVILFVTAMGSLVVWKVLSDPDITFLYSEKGAEWIRFQEQTRLKIRYSQTLVTVFRTSFETNELSNEAVLHFSAMKVAGVWLDGKELYRENPSQVNEWKKVRHIDIASKLIPGIHEIRIAVQNQNGHPALIAYCKPLGLFTGKHWEASMDGRSWGKALPADDVTPLPLSHSFQRADHAVISNVYIFIPIFMAAVLCSFFFIRTPQTSLSNFLKPSAEKIRWILLILWMVMAINNIYKIPLDIGMDIKGHMQYIMYVVDNMRIPLAIEGWQMFQPPLFYLISAGIYKIFPISFSPDLLEQIMRVIPLMCGAAQVEISYRVLRYVYPARDDLQAIGMVIGGLLPMNIYMSQFAGNEPLAAFFSSIVILLSIRQFCSPLLPSKSGIISIGLFLGLAILTKTSAALLVLPTAVFIFYKISTAMPSKSRSTAEAVKSIILIFGVIFVVAGWYYIRNWIEMGQIVIGGWDSSRNIIWWQDPGYRTPRQFLTFGEALYYPVYSAVVSVWDGLYSTLWMDGYLSAYNRPPWNFDFMLSSAWLSLIPSAAIILGILSVLVRQGWQNRQGQLYAVVCVIIYTSAIIYLYLTVPILSTAKASYALGITPCLAILCAHGFEIMIRRPVLKAVAFGGIACWAFAAYAAYFVL